MPNDSIQPNTKETLFKYVSLSQIFLSLRKFIYTYMPYKTLLQTPSFIICILFLYIFSFLFSFATAIKYVVLYVLFLYSFLRGKCISPTIFLDRNRNNEPVKNQSNKTLELPMTITIVNNNNKLY